MKMKTNAEKFHSVLLQPDESEKQVGAFNTAVLVKNTSGRVCGSFSLQQSD